MARPRDLRRKEMIIEEYQRQIRMTGRPNYPAITKAVGLFSNHGKYAARIIQRWREEQAAAKSQIRECLCCPDTFVSTGKHHRLCDRCRFNGEYATPYSLSPSLHQVGRG